MKLTTVLAKTLAAITLLFTTACGNHGDHHMMNAGETVIQGDLTVSGSWVRAAEPPAKTSAVYLTIDNAGTEADSLIAVSSELAEFTEIHQSLKEDGVSLMRKVKAIEVPANGSANLEPGGYHVMLINLNGEIAADETYSLTLTFEKAGEVVVKPLARKAKAGGHHDHH